MGVGTTNMEAMKKADPVNWNSWRRR